MIVCLAVIIAILVKKYRQLTLTLSATVPSSASRNQDHELVELSLASHTPAEYEIPVPRVKPTVVYETPMLSAEEPITVLTKNMAYTTWLPPTEGGNVLPAPTDIN